MLFLNGTHLGARDPTPTIANFLPGRGASWPPKSSPRDRRWLDPSEGTPGPPSPCARPGRRPPSRSRAVAGGRPLLPHLPAMAAALLRRGFSTPPLRGWATASAPPRSPCSGRSRRRWPGSLHGTSHFVTAGFFVAPFLRLDNVRLLRVATTGDFYGRVLRLHGRVYGLPSMVASTAGVASTGGGGKCDRHYSIMQRVR